MGYRIMILSRLGKHHTQFLETHSLSFVAWGPWCLQKRSTAVSSGVSVRSQVLPNQNWLVWSRQMGNCMIESVPFVALWALAQEHYHGSITPQCFVTILVNCWGLICVGWISPLELEETCFWIKIDGVVVWIRLQMCLFWFSTVFFL